MSILSSRSKRTSLEAGVPFWEAIGGQRDGLKLGYRRNRRGASSWIAKARIDGGVHQGGIGQADDAAGGGLSYTEAVAAAGRWRDTLMVRLAEEKQAVDQQILEGERLAASVRGHITRYLDKRMADNGTESHDNAKARLGAHVLRDPIADREVAGLTAADIKSWRSRLRKVRRGKAQRMAASSEKRLMADLRAAIGESLSNATRKALAPHPGAGSTSRDLPYWGPIEIGGVMSAAMVVDVDLAHLTLVLASTGARFSQARRVRVRDVLAEAAIILVPRSGKGSVAKSRTPIRVPVGPDVIESLKPLLAGRRGEELLLLRVERSGRRVAWDKARSMRDGWLQAVAIAGLEAAPPYVLRHSSIIRWLRAGVSGEVVADLHDTSTAMLRMTYSADLSGKSEDLLRERPKGMAPLTGGTVVRLRSV